MAAGRNEPCPCGSGRKFKSCCIAKRQKPRGMMMLLAALLTLAVAGAVSVASGGDDSADGTPRTAPKRNAPPGKVWSVEHGHWHDAKSTPAPVRTPAPAAPQARPGSPQPGPAPAGQVWSTEHGHWHDARTP